ncbi:MAG TPA: DUF4157 domain-containing protein [Kofleriaceae bacterium]|nr:DUF4157 domain-containing protein [Kofleriaceae bacterium]
MARLQAQTTTEVGKVFRRIGAGGARGGAQIPESGGAPLAGNVRARMEPALGADLSHVNVSTTPDSARAAGDLGARAFTVGSNIHFNQGEYAPGTKEGDRLLAHELTHAVQGQRSGVQRKAKKPEPGAEGEDGAEHADSDLEVSEPGDPAEQEADGVADDVADQLHDEQPGKKREPKPIAGEGGAVQRKIYRAEKKGATPPPIPAAAGKPKAGAPAAAGAAPAAAAPATPPDPPTADEELARLQKLDVAGATSATASKLSLDLGSLELWLQMQKSFAGSLKVKQIRELCLEKKSLLEDKCMVDLTINVQTVLSGLKGTDPAAYVKLAPLRTRVDAWRPAFKDSANGAAGATIKDLSKQIDDKQAELVVSRDKAVADATAAVAALDPSKPDQGNLTEKLNAELAKAEPWMSAPIPDPAGKVVQLRANKTVKEQAIATAAAAPKPVPPAAPAATPSGKPAAPADQAAAPGGKPAAPADQAGAPAAATPEAPATTASASTTATSAASAHADPAAKHGAAPGGHAAPEMTPEQKVLHDKQQLLITVIKGIAAQAQVKATHVDQGLSATLTGLGIAAGIAVPVLAPVAGVISLGISLWTSGAKRKKADQVKAITELLPLLTDPAKIDEVIGFYASGVTDLETLNQLITAKIQEQPAPKPEAAAGGAPGAEKREGLPGAHGAGGEAGHEGGHGGLAHKVHQGETTAHVVHTAVEGVAAASHAVHHALELVLPGVGIAVNLVKQGLAINELGTLKEAIAEKKKIDDQLAAAAGGAAAPAGGAAPPAKP